MIYLTLKTHDSGISHQTHYPYEETPGGSFLCIFLLLPYNILPLQGLMRSVSVTKNQKFKKR